MLSSDELHPLAKEFGDTVRDRFPLETIFQRQRLTIGFSIGALVALSWAYLVLMAIEMANHDSWASLGPGMSFFDSPETDWSAFAQTCLSITSEAGTALGGFLMMPSHGAWSFTDLILVFVMWQVMVVAMMLPTAALTLLTFADINGNRYKGPSLFARTRNFITGYLLSWRSFSVLATLAQWGLKEAALLSKGMVAVNPYLIGGVLFLAGAYQWSPLKEFCLNQCRNPMLFFMNKWRNGLSGALRMGIHHGLYCLGCCWALMMVMFVTGTMNLAWAGILAVVMLAEKIVPHGELSGKVLGLMIAPSGLFLILTKLI